MNRLLRILLLLAVLVPAAACGQKGDLYLPDKLRATSPVPAGPA